eukprot:2748003-Prymnesium_polylepis.1
MWLTFVDYAAALLIVWLSYNLYRGRVLWLTDQENRKRGESMIGKRVRLINVDQRPELEGKLGWAYEYVREKNRVRLMIEEHPEQSLEAALKCVELHPTQEPPERRAGAISHRLNNLMTKGHSACSLSEPVFPGNTAPAPTAAAGPAPAPTAAAASATVPAAAAVAAAAPVPPPPAAAAAGAGPATLP